MQNKTGLQGRSSKLSAGFRYEGVIESKIATCSLHEELCDVFLVPQTSFTQLKTCRVDVKTTWCALRLVKQLFFFEGAFYVSPEGS